MHQDPNLSQMHPLYFLELVLLDSTRHLDSCHNRFSGEVYCSSITDLYHLHYFYLHPHLGHG
jgi:hypothetical protein